MTALLDTGAIAFTVYGTPVPQGSTRGFIPKGWKRPVITTDNSKLKPFRQQIASTALEFKARAFGRQAAICMTLDFYFRRPEGVPKKRVYPTVRPDIDKITRSILDSLTGILYVDDAQVIDVHPRKFYGVPERVEISLWEVA